MVTTIARHKLSGSASNHVSLSSGSDMKNRMTVRYGPGPATALWNSSRLGHKYVGRAAPVSLPAAASMDWLHLRDTLNMFMSLCPCHQKKFLLSLRVALDYWSDQRGSGNDVSKSATRVWLSCCFLFFQNKTHRSIVSHSMIFKQSFQTPITLLYFILYSRVQTQKTTTTKIKACKCWAIKTKRHLFQCFQEQDKNLVPLSEGLVRDFMISCSASINPHINVYRNHLSKAWNGKIWLVTNLWPALVHLKKHSKCIPERHL